MADFHLVDIHGWEYDLHSVYTAYMGYFQLHGIPWYERSWGHLFSTFDDFLSFSWPVITVTDARTGRAHIVTRLTSIGAFVKMIKTRFGDTLPLVDHILKITPFETQQRHLRTISDYQTYQKLHQTMPAVMLGALKARIRSGDPKSVIDLWHQRNKTFIAIDFECAERNAATILEWGYTAVRCGHLETKGHYVISEFVDKVQNRHNPTFPWQFGESQVLNRNKLPQIIQAVVASLASPDSETTPNELVLVSHSAAEDLKRLEEMKIKVPHNVLIVDLVALESSLFRSGVRGTMLDARTGKSRQPGSTLSLRSIMHSLSVTLDYPLHNAGNDAFACLLAMQLLVDPKNTRVPATPPVNNRPLSTPSPSAFGRTRTTSNNVTMPVDDEGRLPSRRLSISATDALSAQMVRATIG
ncbi:hypothetical protein K488DRAFT_77531 [Vararia minispora EC-137]|uniref:Uncharacterized protein n=1 Tax=Vararia minispora EC-137 TaxID=1314806 RepID=A0ACB8QQH8_9AGAM|nr:hypothetical protein K488DRAFT_77531 [Vararia minispora EC-137]